MKKLLALCLLALSMGCVGNKYRWKPDSISVGQGTFNFPNSTYYEIGLSGEIANSGGIRFDIFSIASFSAHGDRNHSVGGGFSFEIPIGSK